MIERIGIYGGTFNPPHLGHLAAARFFADALRLDRVIVLPVGEPPLKAAPLGASSADRLHLCELTFAASRFSIDARELHRPGPSYTVDTLRELREAYPGCAWFMLIGTDQLESFTRWKDWREILRMCTLCVLRRDGTPLALPPELPEDRVRLLPGFVPVEISSTQIREKLGAGEDASPWLAPAAMCYIEKTKLYVPVLPGRAEARALAEAMLPPKRLRHSECVAEAAEALAKQYGADAERAWLAGMLHDCAKYVPPEEQKNLCARYGKPLTAEDEAAPAIWHAFAGEAWLSLERGITDPALLGAVRWHTLGHGGMTLLEKVVFVADLISAERDYPDVERVRKLAAQDLDAAAKYILEHIFAERRRKGDRPPHSAALAWYAELKNNAKENSI